MNSINRSLSHAIARRAPPQITRRTPLPLRRTYATSHDERTQKTLKTSSRMTWLITSTSAIAFAIYIYSNTTPDPNNRDPNQEKVKHDKQPDLEAAKPVEDRHGDTVKKHSIAAKKNQNKERNAVFGEGSFDNHELKHSGGDPGRDFEKK